mmetsp:Transcript_2003/g.5328  ORF Transcript_2003/g.5328 Transcript_2003/m.5328 type:complete len:335 (-) Transcript_2003:178-1182(-)
MPFAAIPNAETSSAPASIRSRSKWRKVERETQQNRNKNRNKNRTETQQEIKATNCPPRLVLFRVVSFRFSSYCAGRRFGTSRGSPMSGSEAAMDAVEFVLEAICCCWCCCCCCCCCCWACTEGSSGRAARKESPSTKPTPTPIPKMARAAFMVVSSKYARTERQMHTRSTYLWTGRRTSRDFRDSVSVVAGRTDSRSVSGACGCGCCCCCSCGGCCGGCCCWQLCRRSKSWACSCCPRLTSACSFRRRRRRRDGVGLPWFERVSPEGTPGSESPLLSPVRSLSLSLRDGGFCGLCSCPWSWVPSLPARARSAVTAGTKEEDEEEVDDSIVMIRL